MLQRKTLRKLTWLTFMPLLFVNSYFVMLLNFSCDGFKYYGVYFDVQQGLRDDLKLLIMSATLDNDRLQ
ncbi:hypothetical protein OSJ98_23790, partial [Escherichia coli]|nr:hypothetical protein [Escherichia coli]